MCNFFHLPIIILLGCILILIFIFLLQYTTKSFIEFIPNYNKSPIINLQPQINNNNYIKQINDLKQKLSIEENKNKNLEKENKSLKDKINKLNNEIITYKNQINILQNSLNQKDLELKNINIHNNNNIITSIKPGEKILGVNFVSIGSQEISNYNLVCKNTDLFVRLEERLYQDFPQFKDYDTYFKVNTKIIKRFKTLDENHIKSNDVINIFKIEDDN